MRLLKTAEVRDILDKWDENEMSFSKMVELLNETALKNLESTIKPKSYTVKTSFDMINDSTTKIGKRIVNSKVLSITQNFQ